MVSGALTPMGKVALGQVFLRVLLFHPLSIIPPVLRTPFIYHRPCVILAVGSLEIKHFPPSPLFPYALMEAVVAYFKIRLSPFCTSLCSLKCYISRQTQPYMSNVLGLYSALHASAAYISHNQVSIGSKKKIEKGRGLS